MRSAFAPESHPFFPSLTRTSRQLSPYSQWNALPYYVLGWPIVKGRRLTMSTGTPPFAQYSVEFQVPDSMLRLQILSRRVRFASFCAVPYFISLSHPCTYPPTMSQRACGIERTLVISRRLTPEYETFQPFRSIFVFFLSIALRWSVKTSRQRERWFSMMHVD